MAASRHPFGAPRAPTFRKERFPMVSPHPTLTEVTRRIVERSRATRSAYLARIDAAQGRFPARGALSCANLAHGFAGLEGNDKLAIKAMREPKDWYAQGDPFFGEVEPLPAPLPNGMFNTVQSKYHIGKTVTVCGTVVSTRKTAKAKAIYLNFDRMHPHQDFYATIWEYNGPNFSYDPEAFLVNKRVCVTGKVTIFDDIPRISINNEHEVVLYEEAIRPKR